MIKGVRIEESINNQKKNKKVKKFHELNVLAGEPDASPGA
jgi:hypothetical protein